jgi:hypothetical protein
LIFRKTALIQETFGDNLPVGANIGLFQLRPDKKANKTFLENESRLYELLGITHLLPPYAGKDALQEKVIKELRRCHDEKKVHWTLSKMQLDKDKVVVNNGQLGIYVCCQLNHCFRSQLCSSCQLASTCTSSNYHNLNYD